MIQINLIKDYQPSPGIFKKLKKSGKYKALIVLLIILCGGSIYITINSLTTEKGESVEMSKEELELEQEAVSSFEPERKIQKVPHSQVVEDMVKEIEVERKQPKNHHPYRSLTPDEQIAYQLNLGQKTLKFLQQITSPDIGYKDLTINIPGNLYIYGRASNLEHYHRFKSKLIKAKFAHIRSGILKPFGDNGVGREFSFYGDIQFSLPNSKKPRSIDEKELPKAIKDFEATAKKLRIRLSSFILKSNTKYKDRYQRVYKIQVKDFGFKQFQDFIEKLNDSNSRFGFQKIALHSQGGKGMLANIDAVLFIN